MHICPMEIIPILMLVPWLRLVLNKVRIRCKKGLHSN